MKRTMFDKILDFIDKLETPVSNDRKVFLDKVIEYISSKNTQNERPSLNFICTHNSRRSQFCQVWASVAKSYYGIEVDISSGGTEVTAIHSNVLSTLKSVGFKIQSESDDVNGIQTLVYGNSDHDIVECYSKLYNDPSIQSPFAAIMTCSDADQNCPFIQEAEIRIPVKYKDPKISDNTGKVEETYLNTCKEIATEMFYIFKHCK